LSHAQNSDAESKEIWYMESTNINIMAEKTRKDFRSGKLPKSREVSIDFSSILNKGEVLSSKYCNEGVQSGGTKLQVNVGESDEQVEQTVGEPYEQKQDEFKKTAMQKLGLQGSANNVKVIMVPIVEVWQRKTFAIIKASILKTSVDKEEKEMTAQEILESNRKKKALAKQARMGTK
jgi:hypothetical protein